jgi:hypothetical protein
MLVNDVVFSDHKPLKTKEGFHLVQGTIGNYIDGLVVGIDPGVNFGMTTINLGYIQVIYGKFPVEKRKGWHGIHIYEWILDYFKDDNIVDFMKFPAIVEGAAYHSRFGQVGLEEVRFAFFLALHNLGFQTEIIPPATVRKVVFNDGKHQAGDSWPFLNHNGADSLSMALYGLEKYGNS